MKDSCYLVLNANGVKRMVKSPPDLRGGEIAVRVRVSVDAKHFRTPYAEAELTLGDEHVITPSADIEVMEPKA